MRNVTVRCCRCGDLIEADASVLEPAAGPLRRRRGPTPIDLCSACTDGLLAWLRPELPALDPVEPLTVPA